ncbi:TetR/AcrR family transcriptional regulator [Streptomyces sulphureus]|uniref:TetR/AcrR family transcriptional regulator n=1 Tax=Streptomyces sulphureus TaxID=47758 RepID=UPI000361146F|nr:TetR/AcrR family transcriptional regulator [Streptomyces sulphureus]
MAAKPRQGAVKNPGAPPAGKGVAKSGSARRGELLEIAAGMFATRGYAETTVRDIADEAGILSGSLYHHFSSKEAMLDEILRDFLVNLLDRFTAIEKQAGEPREALEELVNASFDAIATAPHAVALYQNQVGPLSKQPGFEYVGESSRKIEAVWVRVLGAGQKSGAFRNDIDVKLAYRFIRDTVWSSVRWYRPRGKYKVDAVAKQYLRMLQGGLLAQQ